jgi:hypothetical protein
MVGVPVSAAPVKPSAKNHQPDANWNGLPDMCDMEVDPTFAVILLLPAYPSTSPALTAEPIACDQLSELADALLLPDPTASNSAMRVPVRPMRGLSDMPTLAAEIPAPPAPMLGVATRFSDVIGKLRICGVNVSLRSGDAPRPTPILGEAIRFKIAGGRAPIRGVHAMLSFVSNDVLAPIEGAHCRFNAARRTACQLIPGGNEGNVTAGLLHA